MRVSRVPSTRIGRLFHYGSKFHSHECRRCPNHLSLAGLAAGMGFGAAEEFIRRNTTSEESSNSSLFMSEANVSRLVDKLSRMRGAALKLGQFLSIQGNCTLLLAHCISLTLDKIPTSFLHKLNKSFDECKIVRTICQIGKWRYVSWELAREAY